MSALNVDFSDQELQDLREIARERGMTMKALVREATAADIARHRALKEAAEVFRRFFSDPAAEQAFADAFPDDEPRGGAPGRAA
ncbi:MULTISPECIES: hypothetical protein [Streptomyces]|jgi:HEAT repeat protein|uniref:Ribbon-helix-helix protein, copG family n=1 Tax=Streptomyces radiopugnans TaxID=403935 RepID=A0A1H9DS68_9ACTN|nr:hypothetical protein [Streptomyces radiopugnans]URN13998.1 hypothetical protein LUW77_29600 [Streptomyces radiopugnans]SEQ16336.1 hypothetical protein SAMN05216481_104259 [Streptomyces radiopugnans]